MIIPPPWEIVNVSRRCGVGLAHVMVYPQTDPSRTRFGQWLSQDETAGILSEPLSYLALRSPRVWTAITSDGSQSCQVQLCHGLPGPYRGS